MKRFTNGLNNLRGNQVSNVLDNEKVAPLTGRRTGFAPQQAKREDLAEAGARAHESVPGTVKVGDYVLIECIGSGSMGTVFRAVKVSPVRSTEAGASVNRVAIKAISLEKIHKMGMTKYIQTEIDVMRKLEEHPNVVTLMRTMLSPRRRYLVMEYCPTDLKKLIDRHGRLFEPTAKRYFKDVLCGLGHCHANGISWRDAKPENLLIDESDNMKLADFGFSTILRKSLNNSTEYEKNTSVVGTIGYVAPEVMRGDQNGGYDACKADVWSTGCVMLVMLTGSLPSSTPRRCVVRKVMDKSSANDEQLRKAMDKSSANDEQHLDQEFDSRLFERVEELLEEESCDTYDVFMEFADYLDSTYIPIEGKLVLKSMLQRNPDARPTVQMVRECKWLRD